VRIRSTGDCLDDTVKSNSDPVSVYILGRKDIARWTLQAGLPPAV